MFSLQKNVLMWSIISDEYLDKSWCLQEDRYAKEGDIQTTRDEAAVGDPAQRCYFNRATVFIPCKCKMLQTFSPKIQQKTFSVVISDQQNSALQPWFHHLERHRTICCRSSAEPQQVRPRFCQLPSVIMFLCKQTGTLVVSLLYFNTTCVCCHSMCKYWVNCLKGLINRKNKSVLLHTAAYSRRQFATYCVFYIESDLFAKYVQK